MAIVERLRAIVEGMPPDGAVTLPVAFLTGLIESEGAEPGMGKLLTLGDVAEIAGRSVSTIRSWCNSGQIAGAFRLQGRDWRIPAADLQRFIERQQSAEYELPTVHDAGSVDIEGWQKHFPPDKGAA